MGAGIDPFVIEIVCPQFIVKANTSHGNLGIKADHEFEESCMTTVHHLSFIVASGRLHVTVSLLKPNKSQWLLPAN